MLVLLSKPSKANHSDSLNIRLSGYAELYYGYDLNEPSSGKRPYYLCSYHYNNQIKFNIAALKLSLSKNRFRSNVALMAGTYAKANLASEPDWAKSILEANVGFAINQSKNLWIDVGVMPSHIGFESAIGAECYTFSRSIMADNSPYYQTGLKLNYQSPNQKTEFAFLLLNGWQRIVMQPGFTRPALGTQFIYKPNENITFNYSTFIGSAKPDSLKQWRHFHNFYLLAKTHKRHDIILGFDAGVEQKQGYSNSYNYWHTWAIINRFHLHKKHHFGLRVEQFYDKNEVIITAANGINVYGYSLNWDYRPISNLLFRLEYRDFLTNEIFFEDHNGLSNRYQMFTSAISIKF